MVDPDQVSAYADADFATSDEAFAAACSAWFETCGLHQPATLLDLGCGPGNIAFRLAARLPDTHITGLDGSAPMLAAAQARTPPDARLRWLHATLPLEGPAGPWDAIVCNSLLHHLHDPAVLWNALRTLGRPGAPFAIGDLRRPDSPESALALTATYAAGAPDVLRRDFLASLHAAFEPDEVRAQLHAASLDAEVLIVSDRHLRVLGRL
jgi:trans-aconitate methyltransferase